MRILVSASIIGLAALLWLSNIHSLKSSKPVSTEPTTGAAPTVPSATVATETAKAAGHTHESPSGTSNLQAIDSDMTSETKDATSARRVSPVAKLIPPLAKVRAEVEKDPHGTPEAITKFSLGLGQRLDALKSEDDARGFMTELDQCVTKPSRETVASAKTLCLLNAKRVAQKYPSLESEYSNLEGRADPSIKSALDFFK